jgi:superfamily II helicase
MPEMSGLAIATANLKAVKDIGEAMAGLGDAAALQQKQIEFQSKLYDANNALIAAQEERSAMLERIGQLEKEVTRLEAWEAKKDQYELVSIASNVVAYAQKKAISGSTPPHYLCANCFAKEQVSYLQQHIHGDSVDKYVCNSCKEELTIHKDTSRRRSSINPGRGGPQGWMGV